MSKSVVGTIFSLLIICFTSNLYAFSISPENIDGDEGTIWPLTITVNPDDWLWVTESGECEYPNTHFFKYTFYDEGGAAWSNSTNTGDISLDLNQSAQSIPHEVTECRNGRPEVPIYNFDYAINIHSDKVVDDEYDFAHLWVEAECGNVPSANTQKSGDPISKPEWNCGVNMSVDITDTTSLPSVSITGDSVLEDSGSGQFTVSLSEPSSQDLTVFYHVDDASSADSNDYEPFGTSVLFKAGQTNKPIPVTIVKDDFDESDETIVVNLSAPDGPPYVLGVPNSAELKIIDDDAAGITVTPTSLTVNESGTTAQFTVALESQPDANIIINVSSDDTSEGTVDKTSLVFTAENWGTPQTVTVTGVDDDLADGDVTFAINLTTSTNDSLYSDIDPDDVSVTNGDDDNAGITVTPTSLTVSESGTTAQFTVALESKPVTNVTINVSSDDTSEGTVDKASLAFTAENWGTPQTVTVTGVDDDLADGDVTFAINLTTSTNDSLYSNIDPDDVSVTNGDDDNAGITVTPTSLTVNESGTTAQFTVALESKPVTNVTINVSSDDTSEGTVDKASLAFTAENWGTPQTVTVTGVDDDLVDGDVTFAINLTTSTNDSLYSDIDPDDVSVTNGDDDNVGITVTPTSLAVNESGTTAQFTVALESEPVANVTINVSSDDTSEGTVDKASLAFTAENWGTPQTVTVTGVDDDLADGDVTFAINLTTSTNDSLYSDINPDDVSVTNGDDDNVGITVTPTSLTVNESGTTAQFTVALESEPVANVTVNVSSDDTSEGTVDKTSLAFTTENWGTPQTVTVTGVDDDLADGDVTFAINLTTSTSDSQYSDIDPDDVSVTNQNDDNVGITVTPTSLTVSESGTTAQFTVALDSEPGANVTINVSSDDTSEGTADKTSLTFTAANWDTPQTVSVTGVDDDLDDGDVTFAINLTTSTSDSQYSEINPDDVSVTNRNDDFAGFAVTPTSLTVNESGTTAQFTVALKSEPSASVTTNVSSDDTSEGTVDKTSLAFTADNWEAPQTVSVTGVDDDLDDGDVTFAINLTTSTVDSNYNGIDPDDVSVINQDNDDATTVGFSMESYEASEDDGSVEIEIIRKGATGSVVSGTFSTKDGTASAGTDYKKVDNQAFTIEKGKTSTTVSVEIIDDESPESDETVKLELIWGDAKAEAELIILLDSKDKFRDELDKLPPNQKEIGLVILETCPTGASSEEFQSLCGGIIEEAAAGGSVANPLKEITPIESAIALGPSTEMPKTQGMNVSSRMMALRGGAEGMNIQGLSVNVAGLSVNTNMVNSFMNSPAQSQPGYNMANAGGSTASDDGIDFGRWGVFISGRIIWGDKDPTDLASGYEFDTAGITVGVDYRFTDTLFAGLAFGYSDNDVEFDQKTGSLDTDGMSFTFYGSWYPTDNFYVDGSYVMGNGDFKQQRSLDYVLLNQGEDHDQEQRIQQTFNADYDGDQRGINLGAGYDFNRNGWVFGPVFRFEYLDIDIDPYEEVLTDDGGGGYEVGWAAAIDRQNYKSQIASFGFDFSKAISRSWGVIIPQANIAWAKEFKNDENIITGHYVGDVNKVNFSLMTDSFKEDFFRAGLGFSAIFKNNKSAFLMVDGDFGRELLSTYYVNAGFRWEF